MSTTIKPYPFTPRDAKRFQPPSVRWVVWCLLVLLAAAAPRAAEVKAPKRLWSHRMNFLSDSDALAADLNLDGHLVIVQTANAHLVTAIDAEGGLLWQKDLGNGFELLQPVAGHFIGNGRISVVVAAKNGTIFVLDGPTGDILGQAPSGIVGLSMAPTVFPWGEAASQYREGLILYDSLHGLSGFVISSQYRLDRVFQCPVDGLLAQAAPPVVGRTGLAAPEPHISFITTDGKITVFSGRQAEPDKIAHGQLANFHHSEWGLALGDLNGDGNGELVAADAEGYLQAFQVKGTQVAPLWLDPADPAGKTPRVISVRRPPDFAPVLVDVNGDRHEDILIPRKDGFALINGATGRSLWDPEAAALSGYDHPRIIGSAPAVFTSAEGVAYAVFCDETSLCILDLHAGLLRSSYTLGRSATAVPLVAPFEGKAAAAFVRTNTDQADILIDLGLDFKPNTPPYLGWRGGQTRTGNLAAQYEAFQAAQLIELSSRMNQNLTQAEETARAGHWREALEQVQDVLASNPHHAKAKRLYRYYFLRENLPWIVLAVLLTLVAAGWLGWLSWRLGRAALDNLLGRRALVRKDYDRAIELIYGLCVRFPRRRQYVAQLADIFIHQKQFDAEAAPIFERARAWFPADDRYLKALATAYSSIPRHDEQAAVIYGEMAGLMKKPGVWYFILGQTLQKLDRPREALEAFRQTIIHGHDDPRLPQFMTDLYIKLGVTSPEILPTLERVLEARKDDRAFLRTYCIACQEARRFDEQAQQIARRLLELDAAAPPAHVIMATMFLRSGQHKDAMLHAQQILQVNPNDSIGVRLLGACYAAERRLDQTAMKIFAKALQSNPDAPEILIAVSHGFIQEGRTDNDARNVYQKALVHNPQDETILGQLATIAAHDNDDELTIRVVEPLLTLGKRSREMILQLADAYCRQGILADKAEPIYREALVHQPDHATIQDNLAAITLRKGRTDVEAAQLYEQVLARHPERFDIGLQLLRCYQAADLPEKALELGPRLVQMEPENADLRKLMAVASDKADQMESAMSGYEQVLADNPEDGEALCALSSLYGRRRRSDNQAIEIYNRAIQIEPTRADHYLAATRAYAARDSWDHAIQTVKYMLTQMPDQMGTAIGLLENLVELAPKNLKLRWYLADMLIFDNRLRDARQQVIDLLRVDPAQGQPGLEAFDKILEKNPKDALTHLERGRTLLALGREQDARHAMEQAHRYHPDNDEITRNLMSLYQKMLDKRDSAEVRFQLGRLAMRVDKFDLAISCFQVTSRDYRWEGESARNLARCFMAKGMLDLSLQELKRLPMEDDVKELLYELGQRYEAVHDAQGAREVYKIIFANDITFRDVKGKLESLAEAGVEVSAERTAIINSLSDAAKQRYDLVQELGRGAMGIVYKARDNELDELVALKILPDNLIRNSEAIRRFRQEARNARRLAHPHIVRIHDIGEEAGRKYISMEFVQGSDLKQKLREVHRKLPFPATLRYARQICEAMAYAHSIGIVHRDIKPANLMLTADDQIKVTDFGIAKMVEATNTPDATMAGAIIGTPLYMSPEQVKGQQVDLRADIYSMGVVFYEMASGRPPFTEGDLAYQHLFVEPKPLKDVPEDFAAIVMKCLEKEKENRYQSAGEIAEALKGVAAGGD